MEYAEKHNQEAYLFMKENYKEKFVRIHCKKRST
jgi:hypothetical protein